MGHPFLPQEEGAHAMESVAVRELAEGFNISRKTA